jgi:hypothetical protein
VDAWEIAGREGIRETIAQYAWFADTGRFDELAALFTPEGVLEVDGEPVQSGRAAIRNYLQSVGRNLAASATAPSIRHHTSNLTIWFESPGAADAQCYFLVVTAIGVDHWGRYRDRLVVDADRWCFAHRRVRTDGVVAGGWAASRRTS